LPCYRFDIAAIRRYPLGTSYTTIVTHMVEQLQRPELGKRVRLIVDATGVGQPVVEMFRRALRAYEDRIECWAITITGGNTVTATARNAWNVSKIQLVGAIREALESQRLKVPKSLPHAETLKRELQNFEVKITQAAHEVFGAREGEHDDLVLATALPIFMAGQRIMEMVIDPATDEMRPREKLALSSEEQAIEDAEREAVAAEEAKETARYRAWKRSVENMTYYERLQRPFLEWDGPTDPAKASEDSVRELLESDWDDPRWQSGG
jgi:hypothetical protein